MSFARGRRGRRAGALVVVAALLAGPGLAAGEAPWPLFPERSRWSEEVFLEGLAGRVSAGEAARFGYGRDPERGGVVSVGPWRAGSYGARLEYRRAYPAPTGTIRGFYRTEGLLPQQACVSVAFLGAGEVLARRTYNLAPAAAWRAFETQVRFPPRGADAFRPAFGLSDRTEGRVDFAGLTIAAGTAGFVVPAEPPELTRPSPTGRFRGSGAFRLERDGGTSWLVTPAGRPFYAVSTDGPAEPDEDPAAPSGEEWAAELRALGFNSLGGWARVGYWSDVDAALAKAGEEPLPLFVALESAALPPSVDRLVDAQGRPGMAGHAFPDPFDPDFAAAYRAEVLRRQRSLRGGAWLAGWFADNELDHADLARRVYSPHCAAALEAFLRRRYATIADLNRAWGSRHASFASLVAARPDPVLPVGAMAGDFRLFSREVVARYVDLTLGIIRSVDPGRLIFSNRFMASGIGASAAYLDLYARYDGVAVNLYPQNQQPGLGDNETALLRLFHERTGRPVLVAEWSVPALDSGLYEGAPRELDWSWNEAVGTQAERAGQAARLAVDFYNLPFVVGAQWFTWEDVRSGRRANRGLFTADGLPWEELQRRLGAAQRRLGP